MEIDPSGRRVGRQTFQEFNKHLQTNTRFRKVAGAIVAVWSAAVATAGIKSVQDNCSPNHECVAVYDNASLAYIDSINQQASHPNDILLPAEVDQPATLVTEVSPTTAPLSTAETLGLQLDPRVEAAIEGMNLSIEGYNHFLQSIDSSHVEWSQQFREFNKDLLSGVIPQLQSEIFVAHFTVVYANDEPGFGDVMVGNFNLGNLISSMAGRYGHGTKCCGANWAISRHATTHQAAPLNAKLNHNPPYDSISTGVEIEANNQAAITTAQYEQLVYLALAVLDTQDRLGAFPLDQIFKGHGEMRDHWNHHNPHNMYGVRDDFDAPEMIFIRHFVQQFIDAHPEIIGQKPLSQLPA